jgi:hypothetical protein
MYDTLVQVDVGPGSSGLVLPATALANDNSSAESGTACHAHRRTWEAPQLAWEGYDLLFADVTHRKHRIPAGRWRGGGVGFANIICE